MKFYNNNNEVSQIFEQKEVIQFFERFDKIGKGLREEIEVPRSLHLLFLDLIGRYSKLYPLIENKIIAKGPGKITITGNLTQAEFKRGGDPLSVDDVKLDINFGFDNGYKVGKAVFIPNDIIETELIEINAYVTEQLCRAIAMALDDAILNGKGKEEYELEGIIKSIPEDSKVSVTPTKLIDILKPINLLDSGDNNDNEVVAIVNRDTYYSTLLEHLLDCSNPGVLPNIVICQAIEKGKILYADFSKYILVQRGNFRMEESTHVRFPFDETGYKGVANFDGQPSREEAFTLVTLL